MAVEPETHYAKSGDVSIAYQVTGEGPLDLIWVQGFVSAGSCRPWPRSIASSARSAA